MLVNADIYKDNTDSCSSDRKVDSQINEDFLFKMSYGRFENAQS